MSNLREFECMSRKVQTASTGMRIERDFYFEPYQEFPAVLEALQGKVEQTDAGTWKRTLPARDSYIANCFCDECHLSLPGGDYALTTGDSHLWNIKENEGELEKEERQEIKRMVEDVSEKPVAGSVGGRVKAIFRPLVTARVAPLNDDHPEDAFDWLDPVITTGLRQVPWPDGLVCNAGGRPLAVPKDVAEPISVPIADVQIRRILVGTPPYDAHRLLAGSINKNAWPEATARSPRGFNLPTFPKGTLRYEGMDVVNRFMSNGTRCYEVILNFSWINLRAEKVFDEDGNEARGWVTWNHVLLKPWWILQWGDPFGQNNPVGWYYVSRAFGVHVGPINFGGAFGFPDELDVGSLYNYGHFDPLFLLSTE